jgi:PAS domain S-box-containing protein
LALWEARDVTTDPAASELRKTGISVIGDVAWGTHFCYFYETKQDLLDLLIPYFKTGLEGNEFCLWIISNSELLTVPQARNALQEALPDFDRYVAERSIEVVGHDAWFLNGGSFDFHRVANRFKEKVDEALGRGYVGMRSNGSPAWLQTSNAKALREFEEEVDQLFPNERVIAACSYPIGRSKADFLLDVARNHQFAIARRNGDWDIVETPELIQTKAEIKRLNDELERKVAERTTELATTNEALRAEIAERKLAEEAVRRAENRIRLVIDTIPTMAWTLRPDGVLDFINQRWLDYAGLSLQDAIEEPMGTVHPEDLPRVMEKWPKDMAAGEPYEDEMRLRRADGEYRWFLCRTVPLRDEQGNIVKWYGTSTDIEDRKRAEEAVRDSQQLVRLVLETLPVGVSVTNRAGDIILVNGASKRIWGGTIVGGRERWEQTKGYWHDSGQRIAPQNWASARALSKGETSLNELIDIETYDGKRKTIQNSVAPLRNEEGLIVGAVIVNEDVTDRDQAEKKVREANDQLRFLSRRLLHVQEEERGHLARELHDEIGQTLTVAKLNLKIIAPDIPPAAANRLDDSIHLLDRLLAQVRQLSLDLRPPLLDQLGLVPALRWLVDQQRQRTRLRMSFSTDVDDLKLDPAIQTACFRVAQEAITNVIRHAGAKNVAVDLRCEADRLWLSVRDDGAGFDPGAIERMTAARSNLGLVSMKERALLVSGGLEVRSVPKKGTEIRAWFPLIPQEASTNTEVA